MHDHESLRPPCQCRRVYGRSPSHIAGYYSAQDSAARKQNGYSRIHGGEFFFCRGYHVRVISSPRPPIPMLSAPAWILFLTIGPLCSAFSPLPSISQALNAAKLTAASKAADVCPNPSMMGYVTNPSPMHMPIQNIRNVRNVERLKSLAQTVASIKQEISRRCAF